MLVIAPTDKRSKALALATDRAGSVRDYLAGRGVAPPRFAISAVSDSELVRIVVSDAGTPKLQP
jgi:outer membrane protein OmpA-like peptidoglycan-associated protein